MQLATGQSRLEHVAGIHGALGLASADHGVNFVDKQNDSAFLLAQLIEHRLQTLLEFTAEFRPGNQCAHIQRQHALVAQTIGHFAVDDALSQAFDDGGLTHARLANQYRVVLGAALQHLDGAADFIVTTDHRIELAVFGPLGQVDGVFVQGLTRLFGIRVVYRLATAQVVHCVFQGLLAHTLCQQQLAQFGVLIQGRQQHQLAGDELITLLLRQAVSLIEQARQILGQIHVARGVLDFRQLIQLFAQGLTQARHIEADLHQQRLERAALLLKQRLKQMHRLDRRMVVAHRHGLGV